MSAAERVLTIELQGVGSEDVERAFEAARVRRARVLRLSIAAHHRPTVGFAQVVIAELSRTPTIERLLVNHPGLVTRFLVSSIVLASPRVNVVAETFATTGDAPPLVPDAAPRPDDDPDAFGNRPPALRWHTAEIGDDVAELDEVLARARTMGARGLILALHIDRPLDAALRDALTERLAGATWLHALALVHAGAAVGFLASTLSLRASHVRIRSFPTITEAEAMMRGM
jgi:hypothetical protein